MKRALGVAVAIGGLFVGVSSAPVELDYITYRDPPFSGSSGSASFGTSSPILPGGSREIAKVFDAGSGHAPSSPSANYSRNGASTYGESSGLIKTATATGASKSVEQSFEVPEQARNAAFYLPSDVAKIYDFSGIYSQNSIYSGYYNIEPKTGSNAASGGSAGDPVYVVRFDDDSDKSSSLVASRPPLGKASTLTMSLTAPITPPGPRSTLRLEEGCTRCVGQDAEQSSVRPKSIVATVSAISLRKDAPIRREHLSARIKRQREARILAARTFASDWLKL